MPTLAMEVTELTLALKERIDQPDINGNQAEAARIAGVKPQKLHQWLRGQRPNLYDQETLVGIARLLDKTTLEVVKLAGIKADNRRPRRLPSEESGGGLILTPVAA